MSIQRWTAYISGGVGKTKPSSTGDWVKYADHVVAVAEAATFGYESAFEDGAQAERARIRAAVQALAPIDQRVDDNGLISLVYDKGEALAAIDALRGEACEACNGTGHVKCWSPGGPCSDEDEAKDCECCGPCRQCETLAAIDALREAPHVDPCDCDKCRGKA